VSYSKLQPSPASVRGRGRGHDGRWALFSGDEHDELAAVFNNRLIRHLSSGGSVVDLTSSSRPPASPPPPRRRRRRLFSVKSDARVGLRDERRRRHDEITRRSFGDDHKRQTRNYGLNARTHARCRVQSISGTTATRYGMFSGRAFDDEQEGLAVASIARDEPSTLPSDDPFPRARVHRDRQCTSVTDRRTDGQTYGH